MSKLELLNVFLNDRLTAAAEDIFRAVKSTVAEYQSEIVRSKEENERLKRLLSVAVQRLLLRPGEGHSSQPLPSEDDWPPAQSQVELEPSTPQIKEEIVLVAIQKYDQHPGKVLPRPLEEDIGQVEQPQVSHLPLTQNTPDGEMVFPPPNVLQDIKRESDGEDIYKFQLIGSPATLKPACSNFAGALIEPSAGTLHDNWTRDRPTIPARLGQDMKAAATAAAARPNEKPTSRLLHLKSSRSFRPSSCQARSIPKRHCCRECGKGFSFACQLEVHMRWHTKEKPYGCTVCRKSFTTVSMLKRHHRIHTGEKPFRCHVCGKCFNQSAHLNTHIRLHTGERHR